MTYRIPLPSPILKARFIGRPNRFLVTCNLDGKSVEAYLPNPGRLWELLLPGRTLYLVQNPPDPSKSTAFTALAVEQEGTPILLHTHLTNDVVAHLLAAGRLPGFEKASLIRREAAVGGNRYDFLLEKDGGKFFLEVKSCTLFGGRIAMFPDAVTDRGRRHLEHLAQLRPAGDTRRGCLCRPLAADRVFHARLSHGLRLREDACSM